MMAGVFKFVMYRWRTVLAVLCLAGSTSSNTLAQALPTDRASLETAIVYNILLFVQWPGEDAMPADAPLVLCVDSSSALYASATQLNGRSLRRMKLAVQPAESPASRCKAIYVDTDTSLKVASGSGPSVARDSLLIISGSRFAMQDLPTVQLIESGGRLAFDISQKRARQAGLTVSSKLLRLARKVIE